jgi:DNA ligase|nr:MAG TPA: LIGANc [Caudoviricetes sp.]
MKTIEKTLHRIPYEEKVDCYTDDEDVIERWCVDKFENTDYLIAIPYIEGIPVSLEYEEGKIDQVIGKGNGKFGSNYSNQISLIDNLPLEIKYCDTPVIIRGIITMYYSDFKRINENRFAIGEKLFPTITAMVYDFLLNDDSDTTENVLKFIATDLVTDPGTKYYEEKLDLLVDEGFEIPIYEKISKTDFRDVNNLLHNLNKKNENFEEWEFLTYIDNTEDNWVKIIDKELPYQLTYMY